MSGMKVGLIADTHESAQGIDWAVSLFNRAEVDLVLHAGDFISPITASYFQELTADLIGVFGNNDGDRLLLRERFSGEGIGTINRDPYRAEIGKFKIILMHQPKFLDELEYSSTADLVVYGHTHEVDVRNHDPLIVNPGECCGLLTGVSTIGIVNLETGKVDIKEQDRDQLNHGSDSFS